MAAPISPEKFIAKGYDWKGAREMFVNIYPKPTYQEISNVFGIPTGTLSRVSSEENWGDLRKSEQEKILLASDAAAVILKTVKEVHPAPGMLGEFVIGVVSQMQTVLGLLEKEAKPPRHQADVLNTLSFCALNCANMLKTVGIIGFEGLLKQNAKEAGGVDGHGKWDKGLLQQINVTVQGMTARAEAVSATPIQEAPKQTDQDAPPL